MCWPGPVPCASGSALELKPKWTTRRLWCQSGMNSGCLLKVRLVVKGALIEVWIKRGTLGTQQLEELNGSPRAAHSRGSRAGVSRKSQGTYLRLMGGGAAWVGEFWIHEVGSPWGRWCLGWKCSHPHGSAGTRWETLVLRVRKKCFQ